MAVGTATITPRPKELSQVGTSLGVDPTLTIETTPVVGFNLAGLP